MLDRQVVLHAIIPEADPTGMPTTAPRTALAFNDQAALRQHEVESKLPPRDKHLLSLKLNAGLLKLSRHLFLKLASPHADPRTQTAARLLSRL